MNRFIKIILASCFLLYMSVSITFADSTFDTFGATLVDDSYIKIEGKIANSAQKIVAVKVTDPNGQLVYLNDSHTNENGEYSFDMPLMTKVSGTYTVCASLLGQQNSSATVDVVVNSESEFLSFSINGVPAQIVGTDILLKVAFKPSKHAAVFEVSDKAMVMVDGTLQQSGITVNDFSHRVVYTVVAENGSKKEFNVSIVQQEAISSVGGGGVGGSSIIRKPNPSVSSGTPVVPPINSEDVTNNEDMVFSDINDVMWAKECIIELAKRGVINGTSEKKFEPNRNITREEFVKMLIVAKNIKLNDVNSMFIDVPNDHWCVPYVSAAVNAGIVNGIDENKFGMGALITREDISTMIFRSFTKNLVQKTEIIDFRDSERISDYAKDAVNQMYGAQYINGTGDGMFEPKRAATRAEAAKMIYSLLNDSEGE